ncbi:MAG: exo-alpha-sialidase [Candidatus Jettenia sp.]|uniref:Sialidase domain-containing protein n=1 Tax=Candidatus Jettenia caeni TaxID=247490 RepID=I3IRL4_9BACT|nr:sialidase family protein [Candidatus Jettenia sp. AMX1]MBC6928413.1 exo-alpha-sialidase [Candidatus Jettenia sp.]NUN23887.1 exo-alpha-sialidase [Candidatus Jettenia caeni]KAA0250469.1 MAG: exo-alpha-sialidase [Candidatus Jettenia sp. AMX1]MCE7879658.1 exo-alpha-sialidase [Candidatus Jettenia sp. AMX1]MCQ3926526.1 exo-alpha-sialidase [Candidatus Jettenia sp.]
MLRKRKLILIVGVVCIVGLLGVISVEAQPAPKNTLARLEMLSERGKFLKQRLGKNVNRLSSGYQMIIGFEEQWDSIKSILERAAEQGGFSQEGDEVKEIEKALTPPAPFTGNNPFAKSDSLSLFGGFTQYNPSIGWWGNNAVCGFSDSGSYAATFLPNFDESLPPSPSPSGSFSRLGWSRSSNAGAAFTDKGILLADPLPNDMAFYDLFGDPVVRAASSSTFYYACIADRYFKVDSSLAIFNGITVFKSTSAGFSWGFPVSATEGAGESETSVFDYPSMAVKPGSPARIYVAYTRFDFSGASNIIRIELVKSTNGGASWSQPVKIAEEPVTEENTGWVTNSQVAVGPNGEIYVAWEEFDRFGDQSLNPRSIKLRKSIDGGNTFGAEVKVSPVTHAGSSPFSILQGNIEVPFNLHGLAVDTSGTATNGNVYVIWHDGRNLSRHEPLSFDSRYRYADILFSKSTDGGSSWSAPVRVNNDPITKKADQFIPAIAVDKTGKIGVLFYDRKYNLRNFLIDVTVATSGNAGATWMNRKVTERSFDSGLKDEFVSSFDFSIGEYITIAQDASKTNNGFIGAWGDNSLSDSNIGVAKLK